MAICIYLIYFGGSIKFSKSSNPAILLFQDDHQRKKIYIYKIVVQHGYLHLSDLFLRKHQVFKILQLCHCSVSRWSSEGENLYLQNLYLPPTWLFAFFWFIFEEASSFQNPPTLSLLFFTLLLIHKMIIRGRKSIFTKSIFISNMAIRIFLIYFGRSTKFSKSSNLAIAFFQNNHQREKIYIYKIVLQHCSFFTLLLILIFLIYFRESTKFSKSSNNDHSSFSFDYWRERLRTWFLQSEFRSEKFV